MVRAVLLVADTVVERDNAETAPQRLKTKTVTEEMETSPETARPLKGRENVVEDAQLTPPQADPQHLVLGEAILVKTVTAIGPSPFS